MLRSNNLIIGFALYDPTAEFKQLCNEEITCNCTVTVARSTSYKFTEGSSKVIPLTVTKQFVDEFEQLLAVKIPFRFPVIITADEKGYKMRYIPLKENIAYA